MSTDAASSSISTPVLIVGAGPVGLCCALFLARHGITSLLVERHRGVSIHPRARAITVRTMELLRELGLEEQVKKAGALLARSRYVLTVETLAGKEIQRSVPDRFVLPPLVSPTSLGLCAQDQLEPLLVTALSQTGAKLQFGSELVSFEQTPSGVSATLVERISGRSSKVHAQYLVAADGASSLTRSLLHITSQGLVKPIANYVSIYFRADLSHLVAGREFVLCSVRHPQAPGWLVAVNNTDSWIFMFTYEPERGETPEQFTTERATALVRQAIGLPHLTIEILSKLAWEATSRVADHFQEDRIFLAGDAAHVIPPSGGYGMNIGIEDAHNLAWKLALVLKGIAAPSLLQTYELERRPHAQGVARQAELRMAELVKQQAYYQVDATSNVWVEDLLIMLGHAYRSRAVILDEQVPGEGREHSDKATLAQPAPSPFLEKLEQLGRPGSRAPHIWLQRGEERLSTLDLFGSSFVLLCAEHGEPWREAAHEVALHFNVPLHSYRIGSMGDLFDQEERWSVTYGVTSTGAVVIRPDGIVAWRASALMPSPHEVLESVFTQLLGKTIIP